MGETQLRKEIATLKLVLAHQLMEVGVSLVIGHRVLKIVEVENNRDQKNVLTQHLLMVEINVLETQLKKEIATLKLVLLPLMENGVSLVIGHRVLKIAEVENNRDQENVLTQHLQMVEKIVMETQLRKEIATLELVFKLAIERVWDAGLTELIER